MYAWCQLIIRIASLSYFSNMYMYSAHSIGGWILRGFQTVNLPVNLIWYFLPSTVIPFLFIFLFWSFKFEISWLSCSLKVSQRKTKEWYINTLNHFKVKLIIKWADIYMLFITTLYLVNAMIHSSASEENPTKKYRAQHN